MMSHYLISDGLQSSLNKVFLTTRVQAKGESTHFDPNTGAQTCKGRYDIDFVIIVKLRAYFSDSGEFPPCEDQITEAIE